MSIAKEKRRGWVTMGLKQNDMYNLLKNIATIGYTVAVDNYSTAKAKIQIDLLHTEEDGFITIAIKDKKEWSQFHYKVRELKNNIEKVLSIENYDIYLSANSFFNQFRGRGVDNIRYINTLYSDIDYYNIKALNKYSFDEILYLLEQKYFDKKVPYPNFIIHSGRGIVVYWLIEPVRDFKLPLWNTLQRYLLEQLQVVGADSKAIDASRVLRLAGTINQKNKMNTDIVVLEPDKRYTLEELQEKYLPELTAHIKNPFKPKKGRPTKVAKLFNIHYLHYSRLKDIVTIQDLRQGLCIIKNAKGELITQEEGQREFMCFLYRYWSCCYTSNMDQALQDTKIFNKHFVKPLKESEVERATKQAEKAYQSWLENKPVTISNEKIYNRGGYNYKNETLIKQLNITREEMTKLYTIIDKKEKIRRDTEKTKLMIRNEEGLTPKQAELKELKKVVEELKLQGLSYRKIAEELNISLGKVQYVIKSKF